MPELAEVEHGRRVAEAVCVGRRIDKVWCDDDPIVYEGRSPDEVSTALSGARVEAVLRHGKHLWFELDRRPWPTFHFGMTGAFRTPQAAILELASTPKGGEKSWPPRFAKIRLELDDGAQLVMTNKRRLGRIRLRHSPAEEAPISRLGFDPLTSMPDRATFTTLLRRRRSPIKAVLLNQAFAAGVGNWLADEICYQARLDPRLRASELSEIQVGRVQQAMKEIVEQAVAVDADKTRFPAGWLFHRRWGKASDAVSAEGEPVEFLTIGGRTTAWIPTLQAQSE